MAFDSKCVLTVHKVFKILGRLKINIFIYFNVESTRNRKNLYVTKR
jgi:hypothetical protein